MAQAPPLQGLSSLDRRILTGADPFERNKAGSAWETPLQADVPGIYAEQTQRLLQLVEAVRSDHQTRSAVVSGQPGFGKTHLLGRIRARLRQPALFVYVTAFADAERPYRHLLRALVASLERPLSPGGHQQLAGVLQAVSALGWRELSALYPGIDPDVVQALRMLGGRRWQLARTWLNGHEMDPDDLRRLGLARTLATEEDAATAITTVARVLSHWGPVVIAFDQLEFLPNSPTEPGLAVLGKRLAWLHDEASNLLFILACLDSTYAQTLDLWGQSIRDRLAAEVIGLPGLTAEQAQQLCHLRMQALYGDEAPPWPAYPFRHEFFAELFRAGAAGPRAVLNECSRALRELRSLGQVVPITTPVVRAEAAAPAKAGEEPPATEPAVHQALGRELQERVQQQRAGSGERATSPPLPPDASRQARTLELLLEGYRRTGQQLGELQVKGVDVEPSPVRGQPPILCVELLWQGKPLRVRMAFVDTPSGQSFARQMQALLKDLLSRPGERGVVVRPKRLGVPPTWRKGREYLKQWQDAGGAYAELDDEAVAHLDAIWSLLADAASGDLAPLGAPIGTEEAVRHLVKETAAGSPALDALVRALRQLAQTAAPAGSPPPEAAPPGELTARQAPGGREWRFSVTQAVAALACPRYFVLTGGQRPFVPASAEAEAAASREGHSTREASPPPVGSAFHRMVASFVPHLRSAGITPNHAAAGGPRGPFPGEDAWVSVARRIVFEPWRRTEGQAVPDREATALWAMLERAVRFLCRTLAECAAESPKGRPWWALRRRGARRMEIAAEVHLERALPLDDGHRLRVSGFADVVIRRPDGRQVLIEFKTYPPPQEPVDLFQAALYAWMLEGQGTLTEPILAYVTPSSTEVRRFEPGRVAEALEGRLRPFFAELPRWARWRPGDPSPPPTRLAGLCESCPFHPPCPDVFPLAAPVGSPTAASSSSQPPEAGAPQTPGAGGPQPPPGDDTRPASGQVEADGAVPRSGSEELPVAPEALEETLRQFGCSVRTVGVQAGPSFVRYLMAPESQTTVERIQARAVDLQVRLGLPAEPIIHHIPGAVAIDVARPRPRAVPLEEVLQRAGAPSRRQGLEIPLGVRIDGGVHILDLADSATPHLLVAGATGSGKSTLLLAMAAAMGTWYPPQQVQLLLIDPKQVTFGPLAGSPYLWRAPALDPAEATRALDELIREMKDRYRRLTEAGVQSIDEWARRAGAAVARVVCMVDEFASLVLTSRRDRDAFEQRIRELANKGRAAGIHLVLATQRPDSTVISGSIKANFAARVALKVGDRTSSTVILDQPGAQALAGKGELFFSSGSGELLRLQAPHVTPEEARARLRVSSPVSPPDVSNAEGPTAGR